MNRMLHQGREQVRGVASAAASMAVEEGKIRGQTHSYHQKGKVRQAMSCEAL